MRADFVILALAGSRAAWTRLLGMVGGIALGTALLLVLLGAYNGLGARDARTGWINFGGEPAMAGTMPDRDHVLAGKVADWFEGRPILRIDVAQAEGSRVKLPGIDAPLAEGHFRASPALLELMAQTPREHLAERYGIADGAIGAEALEGPDTLALIQAVPVESLAQRRGVVLAQSLAGPPSGESLGYRVVVAIGAIGIFFPVLLLIAIVTQLGAAARIEAFSTLRLIGATPRQLSLITGIENLAVSLAGALLGTILTFAIVPVAALFPVNGSRFYLGDLAVTPTTMAVAMGGMLAASALATLIGMGRSRPGPLGVTRQVLEKRPGAWRLLPLLVGLAIMGLALVSTEMPLLPGVLIGVALLGGFVTVSAGVVIAGPWLTHHASRMLADRAGSAAAVIAGNRIASLPKATFRAVSGLIIAVFMVTVFCAGSSGVIQQMTGYEGPDRLPANALYMNLKPGSAPQDGIVIYRGGGLAPGRVAARAEDAAQLGLETKATKGMVRFDLAAYLEPGLSEPVALEAMAEAVPGQFAPAALVISTNGTPEGVETARTLMQSSDLWASGPVRRTEAALAGAQREIAELATIAYAGALVSIAIAGCSLAIATASAMIDRKRVLGLLRLMGMPVDQLYRIVVLEAVVPLVAVLGLSVGLGFLVAWMIIESLNPSLYVGLPEPMYFVTLALGLLLALGAVAATLRMVRSNTALVATRFE